MIAIMVAGFIIGSFYDFQINEALFSRNDTFSLIISVLGTVPGYCVLSFIAGGCLYIGLKNKVPHIAWRIVAFFCVGAGAFCSVFFMGREFFGPNGFYFIGVHRAWGYLIALAPAVAVGFLGYYLTSKSNYEKLWLVYFIIALVYLLSLVGGVTVIKSIVHRPRFRSLGMVPDLDFHNWWVPCKEYKDYLLYAQEHNIALIEEEFKSFPSGHAGTAATFMCFAIFLPYIDEKYDTASLVTYICGGLWYLLVSSARMRVGAHFLSDVSMGGLLCIVPYFVAKVLMDELKYFRTQEVQN